jgi:glycosyltransferase involved in cell wall biosynthesis
MNEERKDLVSQVTADELVSAKSFAEVIRPALIVSEQTVFEYSLFLEHLLAGLADESLPTALICPPLCHVDSFIYGAVDVFRYPVINLPFAEPYNRSVLIEQLAKFKPTVLHCLCESKVGLTKQLAQRLDLPYVMTVNSLHNRWRRLSLSEHCVKIIVPAKSIAEDVVKFHPHFVEQVEQINIGTFVEQDCACFSQHNRLVSMVIVHPLDNVADFENIFNAIRYLSINEYEYMLVVIGAGRAEGQLRKLLTTLDLVQKVTIVPRLTPWRSVLAAGDIFIQPQPNTSFNPFMLEAMSVGSAVAACKGGVDDLIIERKTAVVFNPNDEFSIRSTLQGLLDRKEFTRQLARGAQQYLRENHSVSKMISALLANYNIAAAQGYNR